MITNDKNSTKELKMTKEQKFFNKLRDIFIGAKVEGQGGFINFMRITSILLLFTTTFTKGFTQTTET